VPGLRHVALSVLLAAAGCPAAERETGRVGVAARPLTGADAGATALTWVDFAVAGCPRYDAARPSCAGPAPLVLRFATVAPAPVASYLWTFGDGSDPATDATPTHTFRMPGTYGVSLTVGGAGGTAELGRETFITVTTAPEGSVCETSGQCASGLECMCPSGCGVAGLAGFCGRRCEPGSSCGPGTVCADLGPRGPGDGWPGAACLPGCTRDDDCDDGEACREVPGLASYWTRACFPRAVLADEGASCAGAAGQPRDSACLGGDCVGLGARGLCAASCDAAHPCPSYALCAQLASGERRCFSRCSATRPCTGDPFLVCQTQDPQGNGGFSLTDPLAVVCAPRRCATAGVCGPDGVCSGGFCEIRSR
jgi:hypothetical protein